MKKILLIHDDSNSALFTMLFAGLFKDAEIVPLNLLEGKYAQDICRITESDFPLLAAKIDEELQRQGAVDAIISESYVAAIVQYWKWVHNAHTPVVLIDPVVFKETAAAIARKIPPSESVRCLCCSEESVGISSNGINSCGQCVEGPLWPHPVMVLKPVSTGS